MQNCSRRRHLKIVYPLRKMVFPYIIGTILCTPTQNCSHIYRKSFAYPCNLYPSVWEYQSAALGYNYHISQTVWHRWQSGSYHPVITKRYGSYHLIKMQGWSHLDLSLTACGLVYQWIEELYVEMLTQKHSCTTLKAW